MRIPGQRCVVHPGVRQVRRQLDVRDRERLQPRVAHLAPQHLAQDALHLLGDPTRARNLAWHRRSSGVAHDLDAGEALDLVAHADVVVVAHADAALGACADFTDVVLEAPERVEFALVNHDVVAQHADRIAALDETLDHETAGYGAELARAEHLPHLGETDDLLLDLGLYQARDRELNVVDRLVDDAVVADVDARIL